MAVSLVKWTDQTRNEQMPHAHKNVARQMMDAPPNRTQNINRK